MPENIREHPREQYREEYNELLKPYVRRPDIHSCRNDKPALYDWLKFIHFMFSNFSGEPEFKGSNKSLENTFNMDESYDAQNIWWALLLTRKRYGHLKESSDFLLKRLYLVIEPYLPYSLQGITSIKGPILKTNWTYDQELLDKIEEFNQWIDIVANRCEIYFSKYFHMTGSRPTEVVLSRLFRDTWGETKNDGVNLGKAAQSLRLEIENA